MPIRAAAFAFLIALFAGPAFAADLPKLPDLGTGWTTLVPGGETSCALGTPFEFHVKPGREDRLFVFLNGGGACWTGNQCSLEEEPTPYIPTSQIEHNDPRKLKGVFDESRADNPLKDWTQVFVTYCTGDVHLGNRDVTYDSWKEEFTVRHRGQTNVRAVLDWVYANVAGPERIFIAGSSAGGYRDPGVAALMEGWGFFDDAPVWVTDGGTPGTFEDIWRRASIAAPRATFAQFDNAYDDVQEMFLKLLGTETRLHPLIEKNRSDLAATIPGFRSYVAGGTPHTLIRFDRLYTYEVEGVKATDWLHALAEGKEVPNVSCGDAAACEGEPEQ
jgi:hypothetical protein